MKTTIFPLLLTLVLFELPTARAFLCPAKPSRNKLSTLNSEKPTRSAIEKAAGQSTLAKGGEQAAVSGCVTHTPGECCSYASFVQENEELANEMERLTKKRSYPLFLMEKAAKSLIDDSFNPPDHSHTSETMGVNGASAKENLVILGAGWGSAALLQGIDNRRYDVTVISPRNYFLFTPMLAGASVGTVNVRSITQPIRDFNLGANYLEAAASEIDVKRQIIRCHGVACDEFCDVQEFEVPYDRLVVAVGAQINTFGIPGVDEYCMFLKQVDDARRIRRRIINNFERANMPGTSQQQIERLLTFAVIGAGPSGVEFAGELRDFLEQDGPRYYPHLLKHTRIKVIEASPVVLRPFDENLQKAAVEALTKDTTTKGDFFAPNMLEFVLNQPVEEVGETEIKLKNGERIPYGLAVWAGGIGPLPITSEVINALGGLQVAAQPIARGKIAVDPWLRAVESDGKIFALGDCTCVQNDCLPTTAQVAAQEGEFLAHVLSTANLTAVHQDGILLPPQRMPGKTKSMDAMTALATGNDKYVAPFQFLDMGILAYTGHFSALAQVQVAPDSPNARVKAKGSIGFGLWRSIYLMKQTSLRNRVMVFWDWTRSHLFGRDITAID